MTHTLKCLLLYFVFTFFLTSTSYAQEVSLITKQELEQCLTIVNSLELSNKNKTQLLEKQKTQIEKLEIQLDSSQKLNSQMELELQNLNASFKEYSKECKQKLQRTKLQRTAAYVIVAGILYAYVTK